MIDPRHLRDDPDHFREGARAKNVEVDFDRLLELDALKRQLQGRQEEARAQQKRLGKESGPRIGALKGALKKAGEEERTGMISKELWKLDNLKKWNEEQELKKMSKTERKQYEMWKKNR